MIFILLTAFIAIKAALGSKDCAQLGLFIQDFENEITNTWNSQENSATFKRTLPTKLEYVCFADLNKNQKGEFPQVYDNMIYYKGNTANTFFYPKSGACKVPYKNIKHLDIDEIIKTQNPYCIPIDRGTIRIKIEKEFNERLVRVS
ncbi:hypothetical protein HOE04_00510 [archaeon]|nr:hypothetical protein [archaeon]